MDSSADDLADVLALVSLFADAMASGDPGDRLRQITANLDVLQSLVDDLSDLADSTRTGEGEGDEAAGSASQALDLLRRLVVAAENRDGEQVESLLARLAGAFPPDERASTNLIDFLSLLTRDHPADESGPG